MMWLIMASFIPFTNCDKVSLCRQAKDCATCATSYTYTFGLREQCRWCVYVKQCLGPLSCPFGKAIVERDPSRCPKKYSTAKGRKYTDALGRSLFSILLAMGDEDTRCLMNVRPDISYVRRFSIVCDSSGNSCRGLLAVSNDAKAVYVAFIDGGKQKQLSAEVINGIGAQLGAWAKFEDADIGVVSYFHHAFY
ncbi:hypothetical protein GCK32_009802, partial [Trichostrongylus colubriformis]